MPRNSFFVCSGHATSRWYGASRAATGEDDSSHQSLSRCRDAVFPIPNEFQLATGSHGFRFLLFVGELPHGFRRIAMDVRRLSVKVVSDAVLLDI